ncbi:MAG: hypothetical protein KBT55_03480 [Porticoccus sp.]|nr:hypothetical protein [Porticoccus sp.]
MTAPLIKRLIEELAYPTVNANTLEPMIANNEHLVLFFPGDAKRYPETNDVAVILPELIEAYKDILSPAVVLAEDEAPLKERYQFNVWPTLVFLRRGVQLGSISKVKDWSDYIEKINTLLSEDIQPEQAIPSITL